MESTRQDKDREASVYMETIHPSRRAADGPLTGTDTDGIP